MMSFMTISDTPEFQQIFCIFTEIGAKLDIRMFLIALYNSVTSILQDKLDFQFAVMDPDNNGVIAYSELLIILQVCSLYIYIYIFIL